MSIRIRVVGLALAGLAFSSTASAAPPAELSRRDRLYDITEHGDALFAVGHPGHLLRSTDGGESWEALDGGQGEQALFAISFNSKGQGAIVGRSGILLTTKDGGDSWTSSLVTLDEEHPGMFGVDVLEDGTIVAVGEFGAIARSEDGGKTFTKVVYTTGVEEDDDWDDEDEEAAGGEGAEAGAEAEQPPEPERPRNPLCPDLDEVAEDNYDVIGEARLADVMFVDDSRGFAVGEFGLLLETTDGGRSFARTDGCAHQMLYNLGRGPDRLYAVGFGGRLVESTDGGTTWNPRESGTEEDLYSVSVAGDVVLLAGAAGTVQVAKGSSSFERVPTGVHTWLVSSWLDAEGHGLILGGRSVILRTDDHGKTLERVTGVGRD